jgi:hypothetical protein
MFNDKHKNCRGYITYDRETSLPYCVKCKRWVSLKNEILFNKGIILKRDIEVIAKRFIGKRVQRLVKENQNG